MREPTEITSIEELKAQVMDFGKEFDTLIEDGALQSPEGKTKIVELLLSNHLAVAPFIIDNLSGVYLKAVLSALSANLRVDINETTYRLILEEAIGVEEAGYLIYLWGMKLEDTQIEDMFAARLHDSEYYLTRPMPIYLEDKGFA